MLQVVKEEVNHYDQFVKEFTERVKDIMGEDYTVKVYKVLKNNSLELDSLVVMKKGKSFAPNIYLLPYYEEFIQGSKLEELANQLCTSYSNHQTPVFNKDFTYSFEEIKTCIIYRIVSYERNKKLLEKIPHMKYLDLAITFHCLVRQDKEGIGTIRITNEHMAMWETKVSQLYELAIDNTSRLFPPSIRSMDEVILGMLGDVMDQKDDKTAQLLMDDIKDHEGFERKMYILSNQKGINGATCLLYHEVLKNFSDQINSDFFILPSSIHEVILVPYDRTITKEILSDMVKDVNMTQVARDEVLSDRVYYYSRISNTITT